MQKKVSQTFLTILAIAIVIYLGYGIYNSIIRAVQGYQIITNEEVRLAELAHKKKFLEDQIAYMNTDEFIKKQSLILFNKVSQDERIYVVPDDIFNEQKLTFVNVREILDRPNPVTKPWYEELFQSIFHND